MQQIDRLLGPTSSPLFVGITFSGLTASRLLATNASKVLSSVTDLTSWIAGTTGEITVVSDGDGGVVISGLGSSSSPTFAGLTLTGFSGVLKATTGVVSGSATLDDISAGSTNVHLTSTLKSNYDAAYTHSGLTSGNPHNVSKSDVSLGSVENTALSTWAGTTNITTVGNLVIVNGGTVGQSAGPLLTFDDTNNRLKLSGADQWIGTSTDGTGLKFQSTATDAGNTNVSSRVFFVEAGAGSGVENQYGFSFIYAGSDNPTLGGTAFTLATNAFYFRYHSGSAVGATVFSVDRDSGVMTITNAPILSALTASRIVLTDANKKLSSAAVGATGSFTTVDLKTVTVTGGIITAIV
jgi:hypothetical protein